jgi:hypothetical protein
MLKILITVATIVELSVLPSLVFAQGSDNAFEQGFRNPPDSAKPRTWWHWTGGNITKEGITKDLQWMKQVGIAGMQLADVSFGMGQVVENKIEFGTPQWLDAVHYAAAEAQRLGLEMAIFSSPGWSETGGPWVTPAQAMKRLVWSKTVVEGPQRFSGTLPQPPSNLDFYADSAVVAFRLPADESNVADLKPTVTSSGGAIDTASLFDDDLRSGMTVRAPTRSEAAWVQFEFDQPFSAQAITLSARAGNRTGVPVGRVLAGDSTSDLHTLLSLPGAQLYRQGSVRTFAFPLTTARFWRIEMTGAPLDPALTMSQDPPRQVDSYQLTEALLHSGARVNRWEEKSGSSQFLFEYETVRTPDVPVDAAIDRAAVVDLTTKMTPDGHLEWNVPSGRWLILRLGYAPTGARNRPATGAGSGLEADKLSRKYMEAYYHGYLDPIAKTLGPLFGKSLRYVMMDSWEAGMENWTDKMMSEFRTRRGYDPTPYLPVLTGYVVQSADVSDRFLWDFRRTLADMWAEYHYGTMTDMLKQHGLGTYAEAAGVSLEIPEDTLLNKSRVTIPMGEFWLGKMHPPLMYYQDVRGAASASHVYGKTLVAAESFTGGGYEAPYTLKKVGDYWFAQGVNRIVFHTSAHQPLDTKPGNTMVGTHINRNITWAEQAGPFMTYLARNSFLLQQGLFVADIAYLLNEGAPSTMPIWGAGLTPKPPEGYDYDYVNTDVLLNRMSVSEDGRIVLPDGMSYRVLVLPEIDCMTLPVLLKIHELVNGGAIVLGPKPVKSPSLAGYPESDSEVQALANDLWGDLDGISRTKRVFGRGTIVWGLPLDEVLASLDIPRDVEYSQPLDMNLSWIHRRTGDTDIYFIVNRTDSPQEINARFRVSGKEAQLWYPDTGEIEPAEYSIADDRTTVPLYLAERQSMFVVFRRTASSPSRVLPPEKREILTTISGPWDVNFPPNLGAPDKIRLDKLESWTENENEGVKYFSGTSIYTKTIQAPQNWFQARAKILFDLGMVRDIAEVSLNGNVLGTLWKPPYQVDVTDTLKPGENQLEIKVTNEWTNRIIGDRTAPPNKKVLSASGSMRGGFGGNVPPAESGLIGPVTVVSLLTQ